MYDPQQVKTLQTATLKWLNDTNRSIEEVEELRNILRFHENRYYVMNDPLISDFEYDSLYKLLEKFEKEDAGIITKDSPTQRVGAGLIKDFPKTRHLVPMLSLENSYNAEDLLDWDRKARELSKLDSIEYCAEPKFDGASISVVYEDGQLLRAVTRGDGETGDDITPNIKQVRTLPLSAGFDKYGIDTIEIRGEVLMNKNNFKKYNDAIMEEGLPPLANPRNAAAGSLRIKDTKEVSRRNLEAFLYHVSYTTDTASGGKEPTTHSGMLEMLWDLGFRSPKKEMKVVKGIEGIIKYVEEFEAKRDELPYEIDGMVIKVNDLDLQERLGMTSHHPRWAIAYKFKARQASSQLLDVGFQVGRTGAVTPVAKIKAVQVGGVTVTSISIHNEEYIREKDLRKNDHILIERSGDVIPQIVKSLPELRDGSETIIQFPKQCPVCEDELYKPEGEAVWRCVNINCEAQVVERIIHFVSKDAMDIRSFGEANVRKFYAMGLLKNVPGIYRLNFEALGKLEGFGKKSLDNLMAAIDASKTQPLHRIIYGLGIRYVGETTAKTLAQSVGNIFDFADFSLEQLQQLEDVGVKVAGSIYEFFKNEDNITMLKELQALGLVMEGKKAVKVEGNLDGQTFLFTGTLNKLKRSEAEEMVEQHGGKILSGVSSKLNYLVVGDDAGSKLEKAKKIPAIHILSEDDFIKMIDS
ncbi:MAG: NAD-dependent DNA ligase LigA [Chitinophagaceae bacterium]|nr:MAG: NAD-dependent DNA ligase LigA [Chitinophagaceae bacterium]